MTAAAPCFRFTATLLTAGERCRSGRHSERTDFSRRPGTTAGAAVFFLEDETSRMSRRDTRRTSASALDDIDAVICLGLGERARLARQIAAVKADGDGPVRDRRSRDGAAAAPLGVRRARRARPGVRAPHLPRDPRRLGAPAAGCAADRPTDASADLRVAFQGTEGAYGHQAACQHFGVASRPVALQGVSDLPADARGGRRGARRPRRAADREHAPPDRCTRRTTCCCGSTSSIVGEEIVDVRHCLLGVADVPLERARRVHSHPQALAQCSEFLSRLPACEEVAAANTALAAERVRELQRPGAGRHRQRGSGRAFRPARAATRRSPTSRSTTPGSSIVVGGAGRLRSAHCREGVDGAGDAARAWRAGRAA